MPSRSRKQIRTVSPDLVDKCFQFQHASCSFTLSSEGVLLTNCHRLSAININASANQYWIGLGLAFCKEKKSNLLAIILDHVLLALNRLTYCSNLLESFSGRKMEIYCTYIVTLIQGCSTERRGKVCRRLRALA